MEVKNSVHLLNHMWLKRTSLMCRLLWSFSFIIFFHLFQISSCWLSSHYPFMLNKSHSKLLEMPFSNLTRCFGKIHNLIRDINIEVVKESSGKYNIWKFIMMQSYPPRALDRRLQEDWARAAEEGHRILMNLRVDFWAHGSKLGPLFVDIRIGFSIFWALYFRAFWVVFIVWTFLYFHVFWHGVSLAIIGDVCS